MNLDVIWFSSKNFQISQEAELNLIICLMFKHKIISSRKKRQCCQLCTLDFDAWVNQVHWILICCRVYKFE